MPFGAGMGRFRDLAVSIHSAMTDWALVGVGAGGSEDFGCVKGLETPFSLLGIGHAAGEFGDFD